MKSKKLCRSSLFQALVPLVAAILVAEGSSGAGAMTGACSGPLSSMSICLPAVEGDNPPSPTDACCAIIRNTDTGCLCNIVTAYTNSMGVNLHASLLLPKQCKKSIPPGYTCDGNSHSSTKTLASLKCLSKSYQPHQSLVFLAGYMVPSYVPPAANRKLMSA